jgi:ElaB/YqjD/DUF883 family membrane-anchored ribosome-binding protein
LAYCLGTESDDNMSKHNNHGNRPQTAAQKESTESTDLTALAEDAQELLAATADVAGEKVVEARKRLSDSLACVRDAIVENARSADQAVRNNPYKAIGVAAGVGVLIGVLMARRCPQDD